MNAEPQPSAATSSPTILSFLKDHWALLASVGYLYLTVVGMALSWSLYQRYGINVFEFAELNDFLLASFREPLAFLATVVVAVYGIPLYVMYYRRAPSSSRLRKLFPISFVIAALAAPVVMGVLLTKGGDFEQIAWERRVDISLRRGEIGGINEGPDKSDFYLIGTTRHMFSCSMVRPNSRWRCRSAILWRCRSPDCRKVA